MRKPSLYSQSHKKYLDQKFCTKRLQLRHFGRLLPIALSCTNFVAYQNQSFKT